jgi:hypothetical protein
MAGTTQVSEEMVAEDAERQAVQDWSQGGQAFALRDISNGGIAVPRTFFREILGQIGQLRASPELVRAG